MRPPLFAKDEDQLEELSRHAKAWACPYCRRFGTFNRHGALRGLSEDGPGKEALRGRRFFCSNRFQRNGCGRTFSILLSTMIAGASVRTRILWRFYLGKLSGSSVAAAWEGLRSAFSLEAAHGWWRRWRKGQFALREILSRGRGPPEGGLAQQVSDAFDETDPIGVFQLTQQRNWPN